MPGPQVAAETVEIVPPSEDQRDVEDVAAALSLEPWPRDAGYETASLAPFAGDGGEPAHTAASDREPEREAPPAPTAESEEGVPFVSVTERVLEEAAAAPANSADGQADEANPSSEPASASEDVLTVTEEAGQPAPRLVAAAGAAIGHAADGEGDSAAGFSAASSGSGRNADCRAVPRTARRGCG
jgi:hypothetical protein